MQTAQGFALGVAVTALLGWGLLRKNRKSPSRVINSIAAKPKQGDKEFVVSLITSHPDFPKKGIEFKDIFPILRDARGHEALLRLLHDHLLSLGQVDVIVGLESRGFLSGPLLALLVGASFVPVRKPGKLPGKLSSVSYEKEYGKDTFEIQTNAIKPGDRVVLFDDLIATGGSLYAGSRLVESLGGKVIECMVIIELMDLKGRDNVGAPVWSLLEY